MEGRDLAKVLSEAKAITECIDNKGCPLKAPPGSGQQALP